MTSSIVPIRPGIAPGPAAGEINQDAIKALEDLLERARSGEVIGIAYAVMHPGDATSYHHTGYCRRSLLGAVALLQGRMVLNDIEDK